MEAWLREHGASGTAGRLRDVLAAELSRADLPLRPLGYDDEGAERPEPWFGNVEKLAVVRPEGDPRLVAVSWEVSVGLVGDASLHLFAVDGTRVRRVLEWSAELALRLDESATEPETDPSWEDVRSGLNDLDYRIAPADGRHGLFVVAAWGQPGFPSSWGGVSWVILRPGSDPASPTGLEGGSSGAFECSDWDCFTLVLDGDQAVLEFQGDAGSAGISAGFNTRTTTLRWRFVGDRAEQVGAPAAYPLGFVDAWIDAPWQETSSWGALGPALEAWHEVLQTILGDRQPDAAQPLFFQLGERDDVLSMQAVTTEEPRAGFWVDLDECPDLPPEPTP